MPEPLKERDLTNGLEELAAGLFPGNPFQTQTIATPYTFSQGTAYSPFTLDRIALSYGYMSYGLVQTVVDQPVEDAFRGGIEIESDELDEDDLEDLHRVMKEQGDLEAIKGTVKWARLYGGAGLIIVTEQDPRQELDIEAIKNLAPLRFVAADRWELILSVISVSGNDYGFDTNGRPNPYNYYGVPLHRTRVVKMMGREAPSFIRQRLQGWGMSELERCMREINTYIKFQNLLYELVDEAKIDVYKIQQFNDALATAQGTAQIQMRISLSNVIKDYKNALVMDKEDDYEQKQIAFGGLADIGEQFRINLAAALKIPLNKLFGQTATGLGATGEDSMENYNALVESDVREKVFQIIDTVVKLRCMNVFGFIPQFKTKFVPLRILNAKDEEEVNDKKQNRVLALYDRDMLSAQESMESLHKDKLINVQSDVLDGTHEPEPMGMDDGSGEYPTADKPQKPAKPASPKKENGLAKLKAFLSKAA